MGKNNYKKTLPFLLVIISTIIMTGCREEVVEDLKITLPSTPILTNDQSWAVVTDSYLRVTEERDKNSAVVATLRRGYILEILSSQLDDEGTLLWYEVTDNNIVGWVHGTSIKMFENREQAETASKETM